jgi:hypothetical protein
MAKEGLKMYKTAQNGENINEKRQKSFVIRMKRDKTLMKR